MITTWSLSLHAIGLLLMFVGNPNQWRLQMGIFFTGWICMTTGFSLVLYSRLDLLDTTKRWKRPLLGMIVAVTLISNPVTIAFETVPALATNPMVLLNAWSVWHRVRPAIYLLEDVIISTVYIKAALGYVRSSRSSNAKWLSSRENRQVVMLIGLQVFVWTLDLLILACSLARLYSLVDIVTSFVYALKLKLEFVFLDQLVALSGAGQQAEADFTDPVLAPFEPGTLIQSPVGGTGDSGILCTCGANRPPLPGLNPTFGVDKARPVSSHLSMRGIEEV